MSQNSLDLMQFSTKAVCFDAKRNKSTIPVVLITSRTTSRIENIR